MDSVNPVWIMEAGVFGPNAERLRSAIERQRIECYAVSQHTLTGNLSGLRDGHALLNDACVIGMGSFPFAHWMGANRDWLPGCWCALDNLACSTYYAYFGKYLLNQNYTMLPGVEALRQREFLFDVFGCEDTVFVRPNSAEKQMTGRVVHRDEWANALAPTRHDPATLVVVATPRPISREWRLVVSGNQIIAASQYMVSGKIERAKGCPGEARTFAETILAEVSWRPDPIFTLDICESNQELYLLELNSFSCAGMYDCNLDAIVEFASALAVRQWTENHSHKEVAASEKRCKAFLRS